MKYNYLFLIFPLLFSTSCSNKKQSLFIGEIFLSDQTDYQMIFNDNLNESLNYEFASSCFYMKDFYDKIEKNAINLRTSNSIKKLIKNSGRIIFNVGNYEIKRFVSISDEEIKYDEEIVRTSFDMFSFYLHEVLEYLTEYTSNIYLLSMFNSFYNDYLGKDKYKKIINNYNNSIKVLCEDFNIYYVDIEKASRFIYEDDKISEAGLNYILKKINETA